jgi:deoxyribose-phosphate aldolase
MIKHVVMNEKDDFLKALENVADWHGEACELLGYKPRTEMQRPGQFPSFSKRIEHTLLKVDATDAQVIDLCNAAVAYGFRSVCCLPKDVARCRGLLGGSDILVVTVLNFPLAGGTGAVVEFECEKTVDDGADEVDMVVDLRSLIQGDLRVVRDGIARIVDKAQTKSIKVILETCFLTRVQIVKGAAAAEAGGAAYVKTSTGFGPRGAGIEDVSILRAAVGDRLGIKASGGIKNRAFALKLVEAGADLVGTSLGPACV